MSDDQRGALYLFDGTGHRKGLAAARDAHKRLVPHPLLYAFDDAVDRLGLVACRLEVRDYLELAGKLCSSSHGPLILQTILLRDHAGWLQSPRPVVEG